MSAGESDDEYMSVGASFGMRRAFEEGKLPRLRPTLYNVSVVLSSGGLLLLYMHSPIPTRNLEREGEERRRNGGEILALTHESVMAEYIN